MNLAPFTGPGSTPSRRRFWDQARAWVIASQKLGGKNVSVEVYEGKGSLISVPQDNRGRGGGGPLPGCRPCAFSAFDNSERTFNRARSVITFYTQDLCCPNTLGTYNGQKICVWDGCDETVESDDIIICGGSHVVLPCYMGIGEVIDAQHTRYYSYGENECGVAWVLIESELFEECTYA